MAKGKVKKGRGYICVGAKEKRLHRGTGNLNGQARLVHDSILKLDSSATINLLSCWQISLTAITAHEIFA